MAVMSTVSNVTPSASARRVALFFVWADVAKPGSVNARIWVRGSASRSQAFAATISACVESSPPLTPMTILGAFDASPPPMAFMRRSSPETWMLYAS